MNSFVTIVYYYAQKGEKVAEEEKRQRRNDRELFTILLTLPPTTLITGMSHNNQGFIWGLVSNTGLCESYIGTLQPELHLQARNLLIIAGGGSLEQF